MHIKIIMFYMDKKSILTLHDVCYAHEELNYFLPSMAIAIYKWDRFELYRIYSFL